MNLNDYKLLIQSNFYKAESTLKPIDFSIRDKYDYYYHRFVGYCQGIEDIALHDGNVSGYDFEKLKSYIEMKQNTIYHMIYG